MATRSSENSDPVDVTREELALLQTALQSQDFRDLLLNYVREVSDPQNRARYESEVIESERERGFDVTFVHPDPGYTVKTRTSASGSSSSSRTAFVNVASSDCVDKPSCGRIALGQLTAAEDEDDDGQQVHWTIPHTFSPPRDNVHEVVYDCVFHPDTLQLAASNECFQEMIECIAMDGIEYNFEVKLDRSSIERDPDNSKYKGASIATIIRRPLPSSVANASSLSTQIPEHCIKYRHRVDMQEFAYNSNAAAIAANNNELVVEISLPLVKSSAQVQLDVQPNELFLKSSSDQTEASAIGHRYALELKLPCAVREDDGRAQFDSDRKILTVVLPMLRANHADEISSPCLDDQRTTADGIEEKLAEMSIANDDDVIVQSSAASAPSSAKHFLLPDFSCHQDEQELVFVLKTENVRPESLKVDHLHEGMACCIRYFTIGAGGVVFDYALFLRFPCPCKVDEPATTVSVTEDSVVVIFKKALTSKNNWNDYFYDTDGTHQLIAAKIEVSSLQESLNALWNESKMVADRTVNPLPVTITEVNSERIVMDVIAEESNVPQETRLSVNVDNSKPEAEDSMSAASESPTCNNSAATMRPVHVIRKFRSVSESSAVDTKKSSSAPRMLRGILKYPRRVRTLSESSDDVNWSSQDYATMDSDILEEGSESGGADGGGAKKSVHFNNNITKTLFRSNSSILGQRKKKERRQRKRAVELQRRTSESECSEGESDTLASKGAGSTRTKKQTRQKQKKNTVSGGPAQSQLQNGKVKNDNEIKTKTTNMDRINGNNEKTSGGQPVSTCMNDNNDNASVCNINNKGRNKQKAKWIRGSGTLVNQSRSGSSGRISSA